MKHDTECFDYENLGRTRTIAVNWEKRERFSNYEGPTSSISSGAVSATNVLPLNAVRSHFNYVLYFCHIFSVFMIWQG